VVSLLLAFSSHEIHEAPSSFKSLEVVGAGDADAGCGQGPGGGVEEGGRAVGQIIWRVGGEDGTRRWRIVGMSGAIIRTGSAAGHRAGVVGLVRRKAEGSWWNLESLMHDRWNA
jgi:hypothetical protein